MQSDIRTVKIFMAEDNAGDVLLIREAMAAYGLSLQLQRSEDGEDAVAQLSLLQREDLPDLIIIDLNLPRIGGMEVLRHARSLRQLDNVPVIVLTSSQMKADHAEAEVLGATAFLTKPPTLNDFISVVGGAIHRLARREATEARMRLGILLALTYTVWIRRVALTLKIR